MKKLTQKFMQRSMRKSMRFNLFRYSYSGGFTLLEVMVVVIILGILASIAVPRLIGEPDKVRIVKAKQDIRVLKSALNMYKLDNFSYPTTDQGLEALVSKPSGSPEPENWKAYLDKLPVDPWGQAYEYIALEDGDIEIISFGADKTLGGEEEYADIRLSDI